MVRILVQVCATLEAQPQTVIPAQGLEWQIEHYFVAQQWLEVDKVALQPASEVIIGFDARIDEQLLDIDLKLTRDFTKAPHAFPTDLDRRCAADQHSSTTDSSRRSSSTGDPGGTPITAIPKSAGASTVARTTLIAPARRPNSWVSRTKPERGSTGRCGELIAILPSRTAPLLVATDAQPYRWR